MCLGVPGRVESLRDDALGMRWGRVSFGGVVKEVCLAYVPEAAVGDHVLVHVGFALAVIDEAEARRTAEAIATEGGFATLLGEAPRDDGSPGGRGPGAGPPGPGRAGP